MVQGLIKLGELVCGTSQRNEESGIGQVVPVREGHDDLLVQRPLHLEIPEQAPRLIGPDSKLEQPQVVDVLLPRPA